MSDEGRRPAFDTAGKALRRTVCIVSRAPDRWNARLWPPGRPPRLRRLRSPRVMPLSKARKAGGAQEKLRQLVSGLAVA